MGRGWEVDGRRWEVGMVVKESVCEVGEGLSGGDEESAPGPGSCPHVLLCSVV